MEKAGARGDELYTYPDGRFVHAYEALLRDFVITKVTEAFLDLLATRAADSVEEAALRKLAHEDPEGLLDDADVLDLLEMFPSARPTVLELIPTLSPMQPRLYSISSSLKAHPDEVHLTVGVVRYQRRNRTRKGVASSYVTESLRGRQKARVFIQQSHGFRLPASGDTPIVMVGPGTGIAPFRAFLQERAATGATGQNWLFFGDQRRDFDFLYRDELEEFARRAS